MIWGKDAKHFEGREKQLLAVAGKAKLLSTATSAVFRHDNVQWLGHRSSEEWMQLLAQSKFLMYASLYVCTVCTICMYCTYVCMYVLYVLCMYYVCMYCMYVLYVCMYCMYVLYVFMYVCTVCMYCMYCMYVCTVCMYYVCIMKTFSIARKLCYEGVHLSRAYIHTYIHTYVYKYVRTYITYKCVIKCSKLLKNNL